MTISTRAIILPAIHVTLTLQTCRACSSLSVADCEGQTERLRTVLEKRTTRTNVQKPLLSTRSRTLEGSETWNIGEEALVPTIASFDAETVHFVGEAYTRKGAQGMMFSSPAASSQKPWVFHGF